jgi:hypothetical protein
MSALLEKLKRAREFKVDAGGYSFTLRRPTDVEWMEIASGQSTARAVLPFVIGWDGVKELDLIPGGDPHPLAFDGEVCREWLADRIDLLPALLDAFVKSYEAHLQARGDAAKN